MKVRLVFSKNDRSLVSRAIVWLTQRRREPGRRCSHVMVKFQPGGVYEEDWAAFEAMERGCWVSLYDKAIGGQTVVAEFEAVVSEKVAYDAMRVAINRYTAWYYDFFGVGLSALWILLRRWAGTPVRWLKIAFRPGKADKALFCSGLALQVVRAMEVLDSSKKFGMGGLTPRTSSPQKEIDACFDSPDGWRMLLPQD